MCKIDIIPDTNLIAHNKDRNISQFKCLLNPMALGIMADLSKPANKVSDLYFGIYCTLYLPPNCVKVGKLRYYFTNNLGFFFWMKCVKECIIVKRNTD